MFQQASWGLPGDALREHTNDQRNQHTEENPHKPSDSRPAGRRVPTSAPATPPTSPPSTITTTFPACSKPPPTHSPTTFPTCSPTCHSTTRPKVDRPAKERRPDRRASTKNLLRIVASRVGKRRPHIFSVTSPPLCREYRDYTPLRSPTPTHPNRCREHKTTLGCQRCVYIGADRLVHTHPTRGDVDDYSRSLLSLCIQRNLVRGLLPWRCWWLACHPVVWGLAQFQCELWQEVFLGRSGTWDWGGLAETVPPPGGLGASAGKIVAWVESCCLLLFSLVICMP